MNRVSMKSFNVTMWRMQEKARVELNHISSVLPELSTGPLKATAVQTWTRTP